MIECKKIIIIFFIKREYFTTVYKLFGCKNSYLNCFQMIIIIKEE